MILIKSGKIKQAQKSFSLAVNLNHNDKRAKIYLENCKIILSISNEEEEWEKSHLVVSMMLKEFNNVKSCKE